ASSLLMGFSPAWGAGWTLAIGFMGSFFILGDSGVLSAAIADRVPSRHLGKVMGVRSLAGFGIGSFAPLSFGMVMDATHQWVLAYATLSAGGAIACVAAAGLLWHSRNTV
ncbi:MAG TPA: MFS transporter, partial [Enterobacteriaceae bacterium]|nr:MFS transporter [Enterobacteriaceae bacterium]